MVGSLDDCEGRQSLGGAESRGARRNHLLLHQLLAHILCHLPRAPSRHLEYYLAEWNETSIIRDLFDRKLLFIESRDIAESNLSVENYRKACDAGKGAILCCVVRGHISEGVHFNDHYGRCCVVMGVPFQWRFSESET